MRAGNATPIVNLLRSPPKYFLGPPSLAIRGNVGFADGVGYSLKAESLGSEPKSEGGAAVKQPAL